jgi:hypothetical protein
MPPQPLPGYGAPTDINQYAIAKEGYLGDACSKPAPGPRVFNWSHWSVMFKSGNMDLSKGLCNSTAPPSPPGDDSGAAVRARSQFNNLPMNQPLVVHQDSAPGWVRCGEADRVLRGPSSRPHLHRCCKPTPEGWSACPLRSAGSSSMPPSHPPPPLTPTSRPPPDFPSPSCQPLPYTNATGVSGYYAGTYDVPLGANASVLAALSAALNQYTQALYAFRLKELACVGTTW